MDIEKYQITVRLNTPREVTDFCQTTSTYPMHINIVAQHDIFTVSARSILGMYSLNLSEPVTITFSTSKLLDTAKIGKDFQKFIV